MVPGIFARTYAHRDLPELFGRIRGDGFAAVQFNLSCAGLSPLPADLPAGLPERIRREADAAGVDLCALSGTYNMAHPDPDRRAADRVGFANVVWAAADMGVPLVTLCTGSRDPADMWRGHPENGTPEAWSALRGELDVALDLAGRAGLRLGVEPEPGNVVSDAAVARRLLDEVGGERLGIVLDAANLLPPEALPRQAAIVARACVLLGPHLLLVHAKDVDAEGRVVPAGRGAVDLPAFVTAVRRAGYDGPLVGHNFAEHEAPGVAAELARLIGAGSA